MRKQEYSLLSDIRKYRDTDKKTNEENFFTEILNWYLNQVDYFHSYFLETIQCPNLYRIHFQTQVHLTDKAGYMDLFAENENDVVIIENKINAPATLKQLQHYVDAVEEADSLDGRNRVIHVFLIAKTNNHGFMPGDVKFMNRQSVCHFMTWQEIYNGIINKLDDKQILSPLWKMFDSYIVGEGLLRRRPLVNEALKNTAFVKGQCISMLEDFLLNSELTNRFEKMAQTMKTGSFDKQQNIEYRWGRIGINLRTADPQSAGQWWPNVFVGFVIDNKDHKLKASGAQAVIIVEWSNLINRRSNRKNLLNSDFYQDVKAFKIKYSKEVGIEIHDELANKWRFLVIESNLDNFIEQDTIEKQDQLILEFFNHWLDLLNDELHIERISKF
mgnify:CR=1 FL=1